MAAWFHSFQPFNQQNFIQIDALMQINLEFSLVGLNPGWNGMNQPSQEKGQAPSLIPFQFHAQFQFWFV